MGTIWGPQVPREQFPSVGQRLPVGVQVTLGGRQGRYLTTLGMNAYTPSGVIGYPSRANAEKGHMVLNHLGVAAGKLITLLTDRQTGTVHGGGSRPLALPSAATN